MGLNLKLIRQRHDAEQDLTDDLAANQTLDTWFSGSFAKGGDSGPTEAFAWSAMSRFERRLGGMTRGPIPAVVVVEGPDQGQRRNVHMLIGGISHLPPHAIAKAWRCGNTVVESAQRHHAAYLAKKAANGVPWAYHPTNRSNFERAVSRQRLRKHRRDPKRAA